MWQDIIFSIGTLGFCLSLAPTIAGPDKPAVKTSLANMSILAVFGATHATLEFWLATTLTMICATEWGVIGWQKIRQERSAKTTKLR